MSIQTRPGEDDHDSETRGSMFGGAPSTIDLNDPPSNLRLSFGSTAERADGFGDAVRQARGGDASAAQQAVKSLQEKIMSLEGAYVIVAILSAVFMTVSAALTMTKSTHCAVKNADARCCSCIDYQAHPERMGAQTMPTFSTWNDIYYSTLLIIGAVTGLAFCVEAIRRENKYMLIFSLLAHIVGVIRAMIDVVLDKRKYDVNADARLAALRITFTALACLATIAMACITPPLYKRFDWAIFRHGGNNLQRKIYQLYTIYRGLLWLEAQASLILYAAMLMYLGFIRLQWYPFLIVAALELAATVQITGFAKQEDVTGVGICIVSKIFSLWCAGVWLYEYGECRHRYLVSLKDSKPFLELNPYPNLESIKRTYNGISCLSDHPRTAHDDRTLEVLVTCGVLLFVFRIASTVVLLKTMSLFGKSSLLKSLFFRAKRSGRRTTGRANDGLLAGGGGAGGDSDDASSLRTSEDAANDLVHGAGGGVMSGTLTNVSSSSKRSTSSNPGAARRLPSAGTSEVSGASTAQSRRGGGGGEAGGGARAAGGKRGGTSRRLNLSSSVRRMPTNRSSDTVEEERIDGCTQSEYNADVTNTSSNFNW